MEKDTILIDTKATYFYSYGCRALTIAHEIVHGYFHKKAFLFAQLFDDELSSIGCKVNGGNLCQESGPISWMEKHANGIAPCLLMPKESFDRTAKVLVRNYLETYDDNIVDLLPLIIHDLADKFSITVYSAKKRLIDIGIWEAAECATGLTKLCQTIPLRQHYQSFLDRESCHCYGLQRSL